MPTLQDMPIEIKDLIVSQVDDYGYYWMSYTHDCTTNLTWIGSMLWLAVARECPHDTALGGKCEEEDTCDSCRDDYWIPEIKQAWSYANPVQILTNCKPNHTAHKVKNSNQQTSRYSSKAPMKKHKQQNPAYVLLITCNWTQVLLGEMPVSFVHQDQSHWMKATLLAL